MATDHIDYLLVCKGASGVSENRKRLLPILKNIIRYALLVLYQLTFGLYVRIAFNLKLSGDSERIPVGPFLLLGNHCSNFDGLFLQCLLMRPIHYVITDTVFKNRALGGLLHFVGYIPKRKFTSDVMTVRMIIRAAARGGVIGIFPEGMRSWDGRTVAVSSGTFKLVKMLKIPVVTARIMGGYLSGPRWANTHRRGRVEVKLRTLIDAKDIRSLSLTEITEMINAELYHDEASWEAQKKIPFHGKGLAEGFERLLYLCPKCGSIGTIVTHRQRICCSACSAEYTLDLFGGLHAVVGGLPADNAADLNIWQLDRFKEYIASHTGETLIRDECAHLLRCSGMDDKMSEIAYGTLILTRSALIIKNLCFHLSDISGTALYFKSGFVFRHGSCEYSVRFDNPRVSVYKWGCALTIITGSPVG
jgi:1-acyl-sn-glycerol-3-phosphate acyltransferase